MVDLDVTDERLLERQEWAVKRIARLEEIVLGNQQVKWRVLLQDEGRTPFVDKWFDRPDAARNFFERLQQEPGRIASGK